MSMSTDWKVLLKQLREAGFRLEIGKRSSHIKVYSPAGHLITSLPGTSSSIRALRNARADLRRAGWQG